MAIKGISVSYSEKYESDLDPDKGTPQATKFIISPLPSRIIAVLNDNRTQFVQNDDTKETAIKVNANEKAFDFVRFGLKGVENLLADNNTPVEFKTVNKYFAGGNHSVVADSVLDAIPLEVVRELADRIYDISNLTPEQAKNSEEQSSE